MPEVIVDGGRRRAPHRRMASSRHRPSRQVELADFVRFEDGRIVEIVEFRDSVALLQMQG